jgi:hypothetical protein
MKPFSAQIKKPARKAGLAAMPTRVMKLLANSGCLTEVA